MPDLPRAVRLVVFDWAGTVIDFGSCAPVAAFVEVFAERGVTVSHAEARRPMGTHKRDHLLAMLGAPAIQKRWRAKYGQLSTTADVDAMYHDLMPKQLAAIATHSDLTPGLLECVAALRQRGLFLGGTTGYFREAALRCLEAARQQGFRPDANVCADDVPAGRPAPWMVYRVMEQVGVFPTAAVLKVGDTRVDVEEGRNAGCWSVAVTASSNEMGLTLAEFMGLAPEERAQRLADVRKRFLDWGAHAVVDWLHELPGVVTEVEARLGRGETP